MRPAQSHLLRQMFKRLNSLLVWHWRLGLGWLVNIYPPVLGQIMVIVHTGRKSGLPRYNPVNFVEIGADVYCVAGFGTISDWVKNMRVQPQVELWLPRQAWVATALELPADWPDRLAIKRQVLLASGFAAPLFGGLNPHTLSDAALEAATADYGLIQFHKLHPAPSPATYIWVWPLAALPVLLRMAYRWYTHVPKRQV